MIRLLLRSVQDQIVRLSAVALIAATIAMAAGGAPRLSDRILGRALATAVVRSPDNARDLIADVDATHISNRGASENFTVKPTWDAMPTALGQTRASMPSSVRNATEQGRYVGTSPLIAQTGAVYPGFVPTSRSHLLRGTPHVVVNAYPDLRSVAALVEGTWPTASSTTPDRIPVVIAQAAASTLHWKVGTEIGIPSATSSTRALRIVGLVRPRDPNDSFWRLDPSRGRALSAPNSDNEIQYGTTVFVSARVWPALAPELAGGEIIAWYPVVSGRVDLASIAALRDGLTTFLANPAVIADGTQDAHALQFSTTLPTTLQEFAATQRVTSTILGIALVAALGIGLLLLAATVSLVSRARRPIHELFVARGSGTLLIVGWTAAEVGSAAALGGAIGAAAAFAAIPDSRFTALGVLEAAALTFFASAIGVVGVLWSTERSHGALKVVSRVSWVGEVFVVVLAGAALLAVWRERGQQGSGSSDLFTTTLPIFVGLGGAVLVLRGAPIGLRALGAGVRRRGSGATYVGALTARGNADREWLVVTSLTATAGAVAALGLLTTLVRAGTSAVRAAGVSPLLPGVQFFVSMAVALCLGFAAAVFAVTSVAKAASRRGDLRVLRQLGFRRLQSAWVTGWSVVPVAVVSVIVGASIGVLCGIPIASALPGLPIGDGSGGAAGAVELRAAVPWLLDGLVASAVLASVVLITTVAAAMDSRAETGTVARAGTRTRTRPGRSWRTE